MIFIKCLLLLVCFFYTTSFVADLPPSYSLLNKKRLSLPKKQKWGTCWAHAVVSCMEDRLKQNRKDNIVLDVYHLDNYNGFNKNAVVYDEETMQCLTFYGSNTDDKSSGLMVRYGGDVWIAAAFNANFGGIPTRSSKIKRDFYFVESFENLTSTGSNKEKRTRIKKAIIKNGSVTSAQRATESPVGFVKKMPIYFSAENTEPNHAINLIGWDDHFSYKNLKGAWIAQDSDYKNKEGSHYHYFYVPYIDANVAKHKLLGGVVLGNVVLNQFHNIYSHSLHGHRYSTTDTSILKAANRFIAKRDETLVGAGIFLSETNMSFNLKIALHKIDNVIYTQTQKKDNPGFFYIKLEEAVALKKNEVFFIILENNPRVYAYDASSEIDLLLGKEHYLKNVQVNSRARKNESFYFKNGVWLDFHSYIDSSNEQKNNEHARENKTANFSITAYTLIR